MTDIMNKLIGYQNFDIQNATFITQKIPSQIFKLASKLLDKT